jgi:predicted aspartyl protease
MIVVPAFLQILPARTARLIRFFCVFAVTVFCVNPPLLAQSDEAAPPVEAAVAVLPEIQNFVIDRSDRMAVPVQINGGEAVPFIVDTGSERTIIANELAKHLALSSGPQLTLATITGRVSVNSFIIDSLTTAVIDIGGIEAPGLERTHLGAYGLLGIDSLEDRKVLLDFKHQKMEILPSPRKKGRTKVENGMIVVNATRLAGRMILSNAKVGGFPVDIILDTGASSSMGNLALRDKLRRRDRTDDYKQVTMRSVTGAAAVGDFTQIRTIEISGFNIADLPITFSNNYAFSALGLDKRPAIFLGMDALQLFERVVIDFTNRRVGFELPKSRFSAASALSFGN